jgi:hypothetical protein
MYLIGVAGIGALLIEPRLPVGEMSHTFLLLGWIAVFYGALALWGRRNNEALERAPQPRDCVGRPVTDVDEPQPARKPEPKTEAPAVRLPLPRPIGQSEVI